MRNSFQSWAAAQPFVSQLVYLAIFVVVGTAVTEMLGGGIPWFGLAVGGCTWVLVTALVARRRARY